MLCMVADERGATGFFRIAVSGTEPVKIPIKLETLIGVNPLPGVEFELSIHPDEIKFKAFSYFFLKQILFCLGLL